MRIRARDAGVVTISLGLLLSGCGSDPASTPPEPAPHRSAPAASGTPGPLTALAAVPELLYDGTPVASADAAVWAWAVESGDAADPDLRTTLLDIRTGKRSAAKGVHRHELVTALAAGRLLAFDDSQDFDTRTATATLVGPGGRRTPLVCPVQGPRCPAFGVLLGPDAKQVAWNVAVDLPGGADGEQVFVTDLGTGRSTRVGDEGLTDPNTGTGGNRALSIDSTGVLFTEGDRLMLHRFDDGRESDVVPSNRHPLLNPDPTRAGADSGPVPPSTEATLSGNGRYVTLQTAQPLDPADTSIDEGSGTGFMDIYQIDVETGRITWISKPDGPPVKSASVNPSTSPDGRYVAFGRASSEVLRWDRTTGRLVQVSGTNPETEPRGTSVTDDGTVTFVASGPVLPGSSASDYRIYRWSPR